MTSVGRPVRLPVGPEQELTAVPRRGLGVSDESRVHHPFDQMFKGMSSGCLGHMVELILERVVHVPAQRVDVAYVPRVRDPRLGVVDRMTALGPGMFEYFASPPSRAAVNECLRKRMNFEHELALRAQHRRKPPPGQWLWILSAGRPRAALREHGAVPMNGWPVGFCRGARDERLCFVLLRELPEEDEDTLFLRLVARGSVSARAMVELRRLPQDHPLRMGAMPVLVAHQAHIVQDLKKVADMTAYEQALEVYREYEQRIRHDEAQRVRQEEARRFELETQRLQQAEARRNLTRLLTRRFGSLSEDIVARIQQADHATLEGWMDRVLTAQSIDDIFA
jgi:hypothetical protein